MIESGWEERSSKEKKMEGGQAREDALGRVNVLATPLRPATLSGHPKAHRMVASLNLDISTTTQCNFMKFCVHQRSIA